MGLNKCSAQMSHPPSAVSQCNHPVAAVVGGRPPSRDAVSLECKCYCCFLMGLKFWAQVGLWGKWVYSGL